MIIACACEKGGVGKSVTAIHLAARLQSTLAVDLDRNQSTLAYAANLPDVIFQSTLSARRFAEFENVVIDTPPSLSRELAFGLKHAHLCLVPVNSEFSAVEGLARLLETVAHARRVNPLLQIRFVLTMFDVRSGHCKAVEAALRAKFGAQVLNTVIHRSYLFSDAQQARKTIYDYAPRSKGAAQYKALVTEILEYETQHRSRL